MPQLHVDCPACDAEDAVEIFYEQSGDGDYRVYNGTRTFWYTEIDGQPTCGCVLSDREARDAHDRAAAKLDDPYYGWRD